MLAMASTVVRFFQIIWQAIYQTARYQWRKVRLKHRHKESADDLEKKCNQFKALCYTEFFSNLSATFIKIGQILSTRPDLLPEYLIEELQKLQDSVPPFARQEVKAILDADIGASWQQLFEHFDFEPIAAASIAQVHKAKLKDGRVLAVKIQRPRIEKLMRRDLAIIHGLASLTLLIPGGRNLGLRGMSEQFSKSILSQLDFSGEIRNNKKLQENFAEFDFISSPKIYDEFCGERVIAMEFIEGKKLTEVLEDPPIEPSIMAERLFFVFLKMAFQDYFIHADMHPGNILVDSAGHYFMIDTGLMYEVPEYYLRKYIRVMLAMASFDAETIAVAYFEDMDLSPKQYQEAVEGIDALLRKYLISGVNLTDIDQREVVSDIFNVFRAHHIVWESEWAGLILAGITFEGIAKTLDKEIDFVQLFIEHMPTYLSKIDIISQDDIVVKKFLEDPLGMRKAEVIAS